MTHYSATSLEQIADELERRAGEAERSISTFEPDAWKMEKQARADAFRRAATRVRNTRLADPAMEAMVKALEPFAAHVDATRLAFPNDPVSAGEVCRGSVSYADFERAFEAHKLAKDNGHVW